MDVGQSDAHVKTGGTYSVLAAVAHDIRTPLTSLLGFLELLKSEGDVATQKRYMENMSVSGKALLELVNDILDFVKLDTGDVELRLELTDPKRLVESVLQTFEPEAAKRGLRLVSRLDGLPFLKLDERRCFQVLFNLIGNAVKYTDAGSVTVSLAFAPAGADRGTLTIAVEDTGIGIAPEDVAQLMRPFVRVGASERGGTGLGLSICKGIVEKLGGEITVDSQLGKGSVFRVRIPDVACGGEVPAVVPDSVVADVKPDFSGLRALIVDDFEMNRMVVAATCRMLGVGDVVSVASGPEALVQLKGGGPFDVVLTDVKMRGMDGAELTRAIRQEPAFRELPVYLVTADGEAGRYAESVGADGYIIKPATRECLAELFAKISKHGTGKGEPVA